MKACLEKGSRIQEYRIPSYSGWVSRYVDKKTPKHYRFGFLKLEFSTKIH